jgi:lipopolysaccharide transport system ATP-binding protein
MSDTVIAVENLGKKYIITHQTAKAGKHGTLRDVIVDGMEALGKRLANRPDETVETYEEFWALENVSFEVRRGDRVGIIGRNGAGKSTLLKLLSRITEPTRGRITLRGRVASLLEVGTGFHPELTGRENIFLNGAILGMGKSEIKRKFDEIVDFAEVEKFLDTPVKRYSSGMYVRLAFAVAAHLEPEILIVDEVLAVGDAQFQKKCLGKMEDISESAGRTVLFVSHNMETIQRLCNTAVMLQKGGVLAAGPVDTVTKHYLSDSGSDSAPDRWIDLKSKPRAGGNGLAKFTALQYSSHNPNVADMPYSDGPLEIELLIESKEDKKIGSLSFTVWSIYGTKLLNADTVTQGRTLFLAKGQNRVRVNIHQMHLKSGTYRAGLWMSDGLRSVYDFIEIACEIHVVDPKSPGFSPDTSNWDGIVTCDFEASVI